MSEEERIGTIFMGPNQSRESTIDRVNEHLQRELWNRRTEAEYMERVKAKATLRVQTMLEQARSNAETIRKTAEQWAAKVKAEAEAVLAEAERIKREAELIRADAEVRREAAHGEGYQVGAEQAFMELDEHRVALDDATASVLATIAEQQDNLFAHWREELVMLLRQAVQISVGWVLREDRIIILNGLLDACLKEIEDQRRIVVRVNPEDYQAVAGILGGAKEKFPDLRQWKVVEDTTITAGGLLLESASGMIDDRMELRQDIVEQVLQHLTLPESVAEEEAKAQVQAVLDETGMTELADAARQRAEAMAAEEAEIAAQEAEALAAQEAATQAAAAQEAALQETALEAAAQEAAAQEVAAQEAAFSESQASSDLQAGSITQNLPPDLPPIPTEKMMNLTPEELAVLLQNYPDAEEALPVPYGTEKPALNFEDLDPDADLTVLDIQIPEIEESGGQK